MQNLCFIPEISLGDCTYAGLSEADVSHIIVSDTKRLSNGFDWRGRTLQLQRCDIIDTYSLINK